MRLSTAVTVAITLGLSGCVTSSVEEFIPIAPEMDADTSVVILTNRQDAIVEAEASFSNCVHSSLRSRGADANVIPEQQFKDALFPWFESRLAPNKPEMLPKMMEDQRIAAKINEMNVRYLVWIHGESERTNEQGSMSCTITSAGGGCVGFLSWENDSNYEASIWDLQEGQSIGVISAEANGTTVIPAIGVPIPLIARTKTASCKGLAEQLAGMLTS